MNLNFLKGITLIIISVFILLSCQKKTGNKGILPIKFRKQTDSIITDESKTNLKIDSLRKKIEKEKSDTSKLKLVLEITKHITFDPAILIYDDVIDAAQKIKFDDAFFIAALGKEYCYATMGKTDSAKFYFDLLNKKVDKSNRLDILIPNYFNYAISFQKNKNMGTSDSLLNLDIELIKKYNYKNYSHIARVYYTQGMNKNFEYNNSEALTSLKEAAKYSVSGNNDKLTGDIFFRIGECYLVESDYNNALKAYGNSIKYSSKAGDESTLASDLAAIGEIYLNKEDLPKARENLFKSLQLSRKTKYKYQEAYTSATIGSLFQSLANYPMALYYYNASNQLYASFNSDIHGQEILLNTLNIGSVYLSMDENEKSLGYLNKVLKNADPQYEPSIVAEADNFLSEIYIRQNDLDKAAYYAKEALKFAEKNELHAVRQQCYELLYRIYERKRDFGKAFFYHKVYTYLADSLTNKTQIKKFAELENEIKQNQLKLEHDKAETVLRSEKLQKEVELKRQRITSIVISAGFILLFIGAVFIYKSLVENRKKTKIISEQKKEVEAQKEIIEEKKKEVMDSIAYAKKIQDAILPSDRSIKTLFPDSFMFYKPKDIVAGDFYWLEKTQESILIAAADCTGHGVPGAMVSVVCSNALNRAVKEFGLDKPDIVLNKVRDLVTETFEKSGSEVKDGMDISLLSIPLKRHDATINISWAGANNPLWYITDGTIFEIKANKQPVGKFIKSDPFTLHELHLKQGDTLFLITDGYADQFGGPKGKKFKYRNLKDFLVKNNKVRMEELSVLLGQNFNAWKANLEQVDDVTVIGIRL